MRTVPKDNKPVEIKCNHCGFNDHTELRAYEVGQVLHRYDGGGNYGICGRCGRADTMVVVKMPVQKVPKPKGWTEVPS